MRIHFEEFSLVFMYMEEILCRLMMILLFFLGPEMKKSLPPKTTSLQAVQSLKDIYAKYGSKSKGEKSIQNLRGGVANGDVEIVFAGDVEAERCFFLLRGDVYVLSLSLLFTSSFFLTFFQKQNISGTTTRCVVLEKRTQRKLW